MKKLVGMQKSSLRRSTEILDRNFYQMHFTSAASENSLPPLPPEASSWYELKQRIIIFCARLERSLKFYIILPFVLLVVGSVISTFALGLSFKHWWVYPDISERGDDVLRPVALDASKELKMRFYWNPEVSALRGAINLFREGELRLILTSKEKRTLGQMPVVVSMRASAEKNQLKIGKMTFLKGNHLVEGEYEIQIEAISRLSRPWFSFLTPDHGESIDKKVVALLGPHPAQKFEELLAVYHNDLKQKQSEEKSELIMKFQTLQAIIAQIKGGLEKVLKSRLEVKDRACELFKKEYYENYGQFFTSFIIDNEKSFQKLSHKDFDGKTIVLENLAKLIQMAKAVGEHSMYALDIAQGAKGVKQWKQARQSALNKVKKVYNQTNQIISTMNAL